MAVVLADVLDERSVVFEVAAQTRDEALREIVASMQVQDRAAFAAEVIAREELHTTMMSRGVAFPHARTDLVTRIVLGIGRSAAGVRFGPDGQRAQLVFVVGVPKRMINDYLVCVGALARMASDEKTRSALASATTPAEFVEVLRAGSLSLE
jgi:mannitol/fructose-specific phosphotransferase system IIA component (Ntr-type)